MSANFYEVVELPQEDADVQWLSLRMPEKKTLLCWIVALHKWLARGITGFITASNQFLVLAGPPGTAKTTAVRAGASFAARILKKNGFADKKVWMILVSVPAIYNKYLGETAKHINEVFRVARGMASNGDFVIIVFDDCESLAIRRDIALGSDANPIDVAQAPVTLIEELDRNRNTAGICVIATTNLFDGVIDPAIISRADMVIHVSLPEVEQRHDIFQTLFKELDEKLGTHLTQSPTASVDEVVFLSGGLSGREIRKLTLQALLVRQELILRPEDLTIDDFLSVLHKRQDNLAKAISVPETKV